MSNSTLEAISPVIAIFVAGAATAGALTITSDINHDDSMKERSDKLLTQKFSEAQESTSAPLMMNLKERKTYNDKVINKIFTWKDVYQGTETFTDAWEITLDSNYETETTRLTLTTDGTPSILEVNASRPVKETGKEADQLIDTANEYFKTLRDSDLPVEKAAGIYEIKGGAVIFQAASQPDTAQVMSLSAAAKQKTVTPPTPGGPS